MSEKENVYVTIIEGDNCYGLDELKVGETVKLIKEPNQFLNEKNELHNRSMHISGIFKGSSKPDIEETKPDIGNKKPDIEEKLANISDALKIKTKENIIKLYKEYGTDKIFGRSLIEKVTGLKSSRASELIKIMLDNNLIESVKGHGKGKYRFSL